MAVAVIQTGGKQYLVREGDRLTVEKIVAEPETNLEFTDLLHGKTVQAKIVAHSRADKIHIVKFKAKVRYLRRKGHRQPQTSLMIEDIR